MTDATSKNPTADEAPEQSPTECLSCDHPLQRAERAWGRCALCLAAARLHVARQRLDRIQTNPDATPDAVARQVVAVTRAQVQHVQQQRHRWLVGASDLTAAHAAHARALDAARNAGALPHAGGIDTAAVLGYRDPGGEARAWTPRGTP